MNSGRTPERARDTIDMHLEDAAATIGRLREMNKTLPPAALLALRARAKSAHHIVREAEREAARIAEIVAMNEERRDGGAAQDESKRGDAA